MAELLPHDNRIGFAICAVALAAIVMSELWVRRVEKSSTERTR